MPPAAIWIHELLDSSDQLMIGGMQTYILELASVLRDVGLEAVIVAQHPRAATLAVRDFCIEAVPATEWWAGIRGAAARRRGLDDPAAVHVIASAHASPRWVGRRTIAIQHGILWDRPAQRRGVLRRLAPWAVNLLRSWRGASIVGKFARLVCVDLAFPTMAACLRSPLPWESIAYIPNFAPDDGAPTITDQVGRIVFSRRLEEYRGTRLFATAARTVLEGGWTGVVHVVGSGPEEGYLREQLGGFPNVTFYRLPYAQRMEAFTEDSLVVVPSLSTEGTSLTCIEGWSRGALVLATGVGGLANLVIDRHNGLLVRPVAADLTAAFRRVLSGEVSVARLKANGRQTFLDSFTRSLWAERWSRVVREVQQV